MQGFACWPNEIAHTHLEEAPLHKCYITVFVATLDVIWGAYFTKTSVSSAECFCHFYFQKQVNTGDTTCELWQKLSDRSYEVNSLEDVVHVKTELRINLYRFVQALF